MDWLGGWLREIILVVLLAAFVELLLPSKSMERYARLVLSLLVLLTILSPIISLLKGDAVQELGLELSRQERSGGLFSGGKGQAESLEQILADGMKLAAGQQSRSLELAAAEVAGQMKDQITSETGERGAKVTVTLGMSRSASGGEEVPVISEVQVYLPPAAASGSAVPSEAPDAEDSEAIAIVPVEPVEVHIGTEPTSGGDAGAVSGPADEAAAAEAEAVIHLLENRWGLEPGVIRVTGNADSTSDKL
ncbi:stage III sporulation protein AF [Paenibacillus donghaensis]|uniref:Stage III sporulation protein AF n=1 Tax=Paenibacillus donghaensis TaxID=414771 RepID=A0A2Z2KRQ0_9BACL|nr:stage III sporulation protein AF [Paenibacillus donghaensis]ASA23131.1 stage III sporulation protein AF [Paenibacillus donghaensis]